MRFILKILINTIAIIITAYLLKGVHINGSVTALLVAIVLALLNAFLKPLLILLTLPITVFTLGFFLLVINAIIILLASDFVSGFKVDGFWWALLFSIVLSIINSILERLERYFQGADRENQ
jgi:putative membrane protein